MDFGADDSVRRLIVYIADSDAPRHARSAIARRREQRIGRRPRREETVDGDDDDRGGDASGRTAEGVGAAQRPGRPQGLHSRLPVARRGPATTVSPPSPRSRSARSPPPSKARSSSPTSSPTSATRSPARARAASPASPRATPKVSLADADGRHAAALRRRGPCRRQDRPARLAPHRRRRQGHGRQVLRQFRRGRRERAPGPPRPPLRRGPGSPSLRRAVRRANGVPAADAASVIPTKKSWFRRIWEWFMSR